eukprot:3787007-Rhodomonas_salina.2
MVRLRQCQCRRLGLTQSHWHPARGPHAESASHGHGHGHGPVPRCRRRARPGRAGPVCIMMHYQ